MASQRDQNSSVAHNKKLIFLQLNCARASESEAAGGEYENSPLLFISFLLFITHYYDY